MHSDPKYLQLCSEKTLQSDENGFFFQFVRSVTEDVGQKWIKNVFGQLKTDRERIRIIYKNQQITEFLSNVQEIYRKKNEENAKAKLREAQSLGENQKSLNLYNQVILKAPHNGEIMPKALLGRAKVLMSLNEFNLALNDIQTSLKLDPNLKFEAFWCQAICYKALGENQKSQICLKLAQSLVEPQQHHLLVESVGKNYIPIEKRVVKLPPITGQQKLTVTRNEIEGKFTTANESIKCGETLIVEVPIVSCLLPDKFGTHCHHCFDRLLAPVGCANCASVAFCGVNCQQAALKYHQFECKFLDLLIGSGMSVLCLAALRTITNNSDIINLCTNSKQRSSEDFLQRTIMAAFLLRCLQKSGFFGDLTDTVLPTENQFIVGEKLLYNLQVLQFNAHEIFETLYTAEQEVTVGRAANIGVGIYPTVALLNHDCYPSVARYFVGNKIIIKALRPLEVGAKISENYGPVFTHFRLVDRQKILSSRYWFQCCCEACRENWPQLSDKTKFPKRIRCMTDDCSNLFAYTEDIPINCSKCRKNVIWTENVKKLFWCESQYKIARECVENREIEKAIDVLIEALDVFHRVSAPPHRETHEAETLLRLCFVYFGNTFNGLVKKQRE